MNGVAVIQRFARKRGPAAPSPASRIPFLDVRSRLGAACAGATRIYRAMPL
jgi:hypothetical protein